MNTTRMQKAEARLVAAVRAERRAMERWRDGNWTEAQVEAAEARAEEAGVRFLRALEAAGVEADEALEVLWKVERSA